MAVLSLVCIGVTGLVYAAQPPSDMTTATLQRCLAAPANASTAGQTHCEASALRSYDRRMNAAYAALMRRLPAAAADRLRRSQQAWLVYRDTEAMTRNAIYATRQGTMFVPMEADNAVTLIGDRTRLLERYVHVLDVE